MKERSDWDRVIGEVHGHLTIVCLAGRNADSKMLVHCLCKCGVKLTVRYNNVAQSRRKTPSCGCLKDAATSTRNTIHGLSGHPYHQCWVDMNKRCNDLTNENYGARGITVCPEWKDSPAQFFSDMGSKPDPSYTLERKNNELGYSKGNCEWKPMVDQQNNKRTNVFLEHDGKRMTIAQWARHLGMDKNTLFYRLSKNWPVERCLTEPVNREYSRSKVTA